MEGRSGALGSDFARLELKIRREIITAQDRVAAERVVRLIDQHDPSAADLERVIVSDPGLLAAFLRAAQGLKLYGVSERAYTSVRDAIALMGFRSVRTIALSLMLHSVTLRDMSGETVDPRRFSRHALFVANFARYIVARNRLLWESEMRWTDDEVFAAAMLHELGLAALTQHAPEIVHQLHLYGKRNKLSYAEAFFEIHFQSLYHFGVVAIKAWKLPDVFLAAVESLKEPDLLIEAPNELRALAYADAVATTHGFAVENWETETIVPPEVCEQMSLPEEEMAIVIPRITGIVDGFLGEAAAEGA